MASHDPLRTRHRRRRDHRDRRARAHRGRRRTATSRCRTTSSRPRRSTSRPRTAPRRWTRIAAYYRERNMAAVVFTVDARDPAGARAELAATTIAEGAARNNDVLIPFGSVDPRTGAEAIDRAAPAGRGPRRARLQVPPQRCRASTRPTSGSTRCGRRCRSSACRRCSTPARTASAPGCPAGAASSWATPTRCCSTTSPPTSPSCRSSWPTPRCRGRTRRSRSPRTRPTSSSTCPAGRPKYFPESLVRAPTRVLQDKVLFGTDYPLITPQTVAGRLRRPAAQGRGAARILKDNAVRLLGLDREDDAAPSQTRHLRVRPVRLRHAAHRRRTRGAAAAAHGARRAGPAAAGRLLGAGRVPAPDRPAAGRPGPDGAGRADRGRRQPSGGCTQGFRNFELARDGCLGRHLLQRPVRAVPHRGQPGRQRGAGRRAGPEDPLASNSRAFSR